MQKITIVTVGRLREGYLREAAAEYQKRLSAYCSVEVIETEQVSLPERAAVVEIDKALESEGKTLLKRLPQNRLNVALCIEGRRVDSEGFARLIKGSAQDHSGINFIIGGSYGLSDDVKRAADVRLSMSDMTFPHHLARIMLLEQIYRAYKINEGGKYHK